MSFRRTGNENQTEQLSPRPRAGSVRATFEWGGRVAKGFCTKQLSGKGFGVNQPRNSNIEAVQDCWQGSSEKTWMIYSEAFFGEAGEIAAERLVVFGTHLHSAFCWTAGMSDA